MKEIEEDWNPMEMWEKEKCRYLDELYGNMEDKGTDECLGTNGTKDRKTDVPENRKGKTILFNKYITQHT